LEEKASRLKLGNLSFEPLRPRTEYLRILQSSDVCVVSIRKEVKTTTIPSKLLDIMACGRPVIADVPLGEVSNLISKADCGMRVEPGNADMFAKAVVELQEDSDLVSRMGRNARSFMERNLSLEACVKRYETIIKHLTEMGSIEANVQP
jgi:colanic acid biosynthesis glycosyl transferase WcaI